VLVLIQKDEDKAMDIISYLGNSKNGFESPDGMTVFGFGRGPNNQALLTGVNTFRIGFVPMKIDSQEKYDWLEIYIKSFLIPK